MDELTAADYRALAEFRYQIRKFLHFSEQAARGEGLEPQQHQMLLAIKALDGGGPTIGQLADHLFVRHHSAVGLVDRLVERRLVERIRAASGDRRQVTVRLTRAGETALRRLASVHRDELRSSDPGLVHALETLLEKQYAIK